MKASTKKLLNEQIKLIIKELEMIDDVKDRLELRIEAVNVIYNISCHDIEDIMPQGKESIKENKAKQPVIVEEEPEEKIEEEPEVIIDEPEEEPEEVSMDEIVGAGIKLDPEVAAEQAVKLEQEEIDLDNDKAEENIYVQNENGEEIDVSEAFHLLNPEISEDFRKEYALQIVEYGTLETYKTLDFIEEVDDEIISHKNLVAYWIDTCELDTIEYYINYFASNIDVNEETGEETYIGEELHIDFLNNNNIKGFTEYVNSIMEE
jgi:hypothetical protein